jgi:cell shape-determining protein MreC
MNDRYKFRNNEIFRYQEEVKELSDENEHLKHRILKYEQINDYIDVLINANHQLEEQLKARALQEQSLLAELEMKVREEERTEAAKIE